MFSYPTGLAPQDARLSPDGSTLYVVGTGLRKVSADAVARTSPAARVYQHAAQHLARPSGQMRLVSGNSFDIAGPRSTGLRTAWVNRAAAPFDTIGTPPQITVPDLAQLLAVLPG